MLSVPSTVAVFADGTMMSPFPSVRLLPAPTVKALGKLKGDGPPMVVLPLKSTPPTVAPLMLLRPRPLLVMLPAKRMVALANVVVPAPGPTRKSPVP